MDHVQKRDSARKWHPVGECRRGLVLQVLQDLREPSMVLTQYLRLLESCFVLANGREHIMEDDVDVSPPNLLLTKGRRSQMRAQDVDARRPHV